MICPVCNTLDYNVILNLKCGGFDNSKLYKTVTVLSCNNCGHIYNYLSKKDIEGLLKYYNGEYSKCNLTSPNKNGDIPGSINKDSLNRYKDLYVMIEKYLSEDSNILDVGCAMGGFLTYIKPYHKNIYGIEPSDNFIEQAKKNSGLDKLYYGSAENIPFDDGMFDLLISDQVVEHLVNPNIFFIEAKRVLKNNGYLCISVPNALEYKDYNFFDFYFFLMREHVQHFGPTQLELIANKHGFNLVDWKVTHPNLISNVGKLPNLTIVFQKNNTNNYKKEMLLFYKKINMSEYINTSYCSLIKRREYIESLINGQTINIYGIGREFFYLWENTELNNLPCFLYDDTKEKQKMTVNGRAVLSSNNFAGYEYDSILNTYTISSCRPIMITSFAHINTMKDNLKKLKYTGIFL